MIRAAALAALLLTGCAATPAPPADDRTDTCDVTVSFGSYAMGVDHDLKTRIQSVIDGDNGVASSEETRWGREGESTLCVRTYDAASAVRIYGLIAEMIPDQSDRAPTTVTHRDGRSDSANPPPEWN